MARTLIICILGIGKFDIYREITILGIDKLTIYREMARRLYLYPRIMSLHYL